MKSIIISSTPANYINIKKYTKPTAAFDLAFVLTCFVLQFV